MKEEFGLHFEITDFTRPEDFKKVMTKSLSASIN